MHEITFWNNLLDEHNSGKKEEGNPQCSSFISYLKLFNWILFLKNIAS